MPRSRSIFIQSERVLRRSPLALTCPARLMAPPNSSNFSVRVVLPASGCQRNPKVRRRATSAASGDRAGDSAGRARSDIGRSVWQGKRAGSSGTSHPDIGITQAKNHRRRSADRARSPGAARRANAALLNRGPFFGETWVPAQRRTAEGRCAASGTRERSAAGRSVVFRPGRFPRQSFGPQPFEILAQRPLLFLVFAQGRPVVARAKGAACFISG